MNAEILGRDDHHRLGANATHPIEPCCGTLQFLVDVLGQHDGASYLLEHRAA